MTNNKLYRWLVVGVLVLILIIYAVNRSKNSTVAPASQQNSGASTNVSSTDKSTVKTPVKSPSAKLPSGPIGQSASEAYLEALNTYQKSGYYMQFSSCQANPGSQVLKKGSKIMLDNRDGKSHLIGIRSVRYNIGAYNFAIATLNSVGTNYVTCDGGGAAQITVVP